MNKSNVYAPLTTDALRPSAVQARLIAEMKEGAKLVGRFDVWGGWDWVISRENGMVSRVSRATVQGVLNRGLVKMGEPVRVGSGRQDTPFTLSAETRED